MKLLKRNWRLLDKLHNYVAMATIFLILGIVFVSVMLGYMLVRLATYAYFRSKADVIRQELSKLARSAPKGDKK